MDAPQDALEQALSDLVARLRKGGEEARAARDELMALAGGPDGARVRDRLDTIRKGELLETQWEIEEIIEATAPKKPEPEPEPEPAPEAPEEDDDPNRPLTAKDLVLVYDDPRGLLLHRSKKGDRWFATQVDPQTGQPMTFELHPSEVAQLKQQLQGSPYWILGA